MLQKVRAAADDLRPDQAAGALRNVSVSKAVNLDKASVIRGRPTQITASADVTELLKSLSSRFNDVVDGVAVSAAEEAEPPEAA